MLSRRSALAVLASTGVGSLPFQRALAASAAAGPVTPEMVAEAEWIAGITLSEPQREAAAKSLNLARAAGATVREIALDNSQQTGLSFAPLTTPESRADPRGYQSVPPVDVGAADVAGLESDEDVAFASVRQLGALLRQRRISSVELTTLYLERLRRYDPLLKCVVTLTDELAMRQARQSDRELAAGVDRGPLQGIPWGLKDVLSYPGYPTTWGVGAYRERVLNETAAVAERLEEAGAVLIAKLATSHFAGGGVVWWRGVTRNPWNPSQHAAGSSSGPASAIAAGLVGFSIATETAGSIMHPSARCGTVGLRPTYGRVSRFGCMQLCWSLDKIGPICRHADDCGLVLGAIHGADPRDAASVDRPYVWPSPRDIATIRVGYDEANESAERQAELGVWRDAGATVAPVSLPTLAEDYGLTYELIEGMVTCESAATFEDLTRRGEPKGVQGWPRHWVHGHFLSAVDYLKLNRLRAILMERVDKMFQSIDVFVGEELAPYLNLTGHPTVVAPKGFKEVEGRALPETVMLSGRAYDEGTLLAVAYTYERAIRLNRRPPLETFLACRDEFLKDERYPDESRYYAE